MGKIGPAIVLMMALVLAGAAGVSAAPFAYIPSGSCGTVSVIDTATNTVTATVTGFSGPYAVAVSPDGSRVYLTSGGAVSVMNAATNVVIATISVGSGPIGVAVSPNGSRVYVSNYNDGTMSVINAATNTVVATVQLGPHNGGSAPVGVAVTPDGRYVYVTNRFNYVSVIDTASNTEVAAVGAGPFTTPAGVAVTPDGKYVYVADSGNYYVTVIATTTNTASTIFLGTQPQALAISPDGAHVYVTVIGTSIGLVVLDTATNTAVTSIPLPPGAQGVAVTPDGTRVYVTSVYSGNVSVIDAAANTVVANVAACQYDYAIGQFIQPSIPIAPFSAKVEINLASSAFGVNSTFTLGSVGSINLLIQALTFRLGSSSITIPAGSFHQSGSGSFVFTGTINGVALSANLTPLGGNSYSLKLDAAGVSNLPTSNPVTVGLTIGSNTGSTSVNAKFQ